MCLSLGHIYSRQTPNWPILKMLLLLVKLFIRYFTIYIHTVFGLYCRQTLWVGLKRKENHKYTMNCQVELPEEGRGRSCLPSPPPPVAFTGFPLPRAASAAGTVLTPPPWRGDGIFPGNSGGATNDPALSCLAQVSPRFFRSVGVRNLRRVDVFDSICQDITLDSSSSVS